jgi:pimeloyl-ACP methyl ester carboxylesterase
LFVEIPEFGTTVVSRREGNTVITFDIEISRHSIQTDHGFIHGVSCKAEAEDDSIKNVIFIIPGAMGQAVSYASYMFQRLGRTDIVTFSFNYNRYDAFDNNVRLSYVFNDAEASFLFLRERYPDKPIIILGCSIGAGPALSIASKYPDISALILDSPADLKHEIKSRWYGYLIPPLLIFNPLFLSESIPDDYDMFQYADTIAEDLPILITTNKKDDIADPDTAIELADLIQSDVELRFDNTAPHCSTMTHSGYEYAKMVDKFIREKVK